MKTSILFALIVSVISLPVVAAGPQWTWEAGKQTNNGAITLKSTNGSTTYASTQNPTGAVVKTNQNAVTQPPMVIVQATASLPVKAVGDACTASTSGSAPNQTAGEGTAITIARDMLLTCQSGQWKAQASSGGGSTPLYLMRLIGNGGPNNCPSGWVQADLQSANYGSSMNDIRSCINESNQCQTLYLERGWASGAPASCPTGWSQADYGLAIYGSTSNYRRACYRC